MKKASEEKQSKREQSNQVRSKSKQRQTSEVSQAYKHDKVPSFLRQLSKRLKKKKGFLRQQSNSIMQRVKQIVIEFKP